MRDIIEILDSDPNIGVVTRKNTPGEELELVKQFICFKKNMFKPSLTNKLAIFVEPKIGNSYPDIVFVEYNPDNFEHWSDARFQLTSRDLKILYHIYATCSIDTSGIVDQLGMTWKEAALGVEKLYDANLIIRKNKKWHLKNKEAVRVNKIEAVEAKINKWEEVFQQAIINKNFASESYALSKVASTPREATVKKLNSFGIGLYIKSRVGFQTMAEAWKSSIPVSFNSIFFNEWIGRALQTDERTV